MINFPEKLPKILVIGDLMIDHYLLGFSDRISPEAPVPIVSVNEEILSLGGAGNVLHNLNALGAKIDVISVLGDCENSIEIKKLLELINVDTKFIVEERGRKASKKTRILVSKQQVARFDFESIDFINKKSESKIINSLNKIISDYDIILLSDYGKGVLTDNLTKQIIEISNKHFIKVIIDPKGVDFSKYKGAYLLTPNKKEAGKATNIDIINESSLSEAILKLKTELDLSLSIITLSDKGIAIYDNELAVHPTAAKEVYDVTGAGDTVLASLGFTLACNFDIHAAIKFSNLAAGVVVGKIGSATASFNEIIEYESSIKKSSSFKHIKSYSEIKEITHELKSKGKQIVFTNGCFDILHIGHIKYLEAAKTFGDILILGLNSDYSTNQLKGDGRPINSEKDRAYLLAAIEVVDYVVVFNEKTPLSLIELIKPNILVKGGDYKNKKVIGQELVEKLEIVDFIDGFSTTRTINKLKQIN